MRTVALLIVVVAAMPACSGFDPDGPFIPESWDRPEQPVDVYSPDGKRLFSGMIPMLRWGWARGDYVYGARTDPQTEEYTAVRYRLVEPFD